MASKLCLNINLSNFSVTQYCGFDFNSFCRIGDSYFGASDTGIYELIGDNDAGISIDAFFELIVSDWGLPAMKRIRTVYIGGESDGALKLTLKDDEDNSREYTVNLISGSKQSSAKIPVGRDGIGRYWQVRIDNKTGAYFAIDSIELLMIVLGRKPR